jgi:hypothetical protein
MEINEFMYQDGKVSNIVISLHDLRSIEAERFNVFKSFPKIVF